jgi:DNA-binding HxlR family transcriptional regulator
MDTKQILEESCIKGRCPSEETLAIIDGKWSIKILTHLMYEDTLRFGELRRIIPGVTQRMLTHKLRELESRDVIERKVYAVVPPKVEYRLTELGRSLKPVLDSLSEWSLRHEALIKKVGDKANSS